MKRIGHQELFAMLQRFRKKQGYSELKKSSEAAAVEWRWASSLMLPELPHDEIVRGFKPPKWTKKQTRYGSLHGLDAQGRVRCIRSEDRAKPNDEVYEQFLIYDDGGFWCVFFDSGADKSPLRIRWYEMEGDQWRRSLEIGHYGIRESELHWEAGRLVRYFDRSWSGASIGDATTATVAKAESARAEHTGYSYSYSADGELERVTEESYLDEGEPPSVEVKYKRIPKGADLKSLLRDAEEMLVAELPKEICQAKVRKTVCGLFLQFSGVDTDLTGFAPPMFLATPDVRERLFVKHGGDAALLFWGVVEWQEDPEVIKIDCHDSALDEKLRLIFQLTVVQASPTNYEPVRKMFQRVCARLNALSWKGILQTTDDFVVAPFDPHGEMDSNADLKASVPAEKLRLSIDRGYMPRMKLK
jgi:hypothetical protein